MLKDAASNPSWEGFMPPVPRRWINVLPCLVACTGLGCGSDGFVPVTGIVLLDNRPLAAGSIVFHPDETKGNTSLHLPAGEVKDGKYELWTNRHRGAPPGAYKVVVIADNFSGGE